jgi:DNA-binding transcriptional LysR family regulator
MALKDVSRIQDFRLSEIELIAQLGSHESLRSLARSLNVDAAQASRCVSTFEHYFGVALIVRSPGGYSLTSEGRSLARAAKDLAQQAADLQHFRSAVIQKDRAQQLIIGARGFLNIVFAGPLSSLAEASSRQISFQMLDLSPVELQFLVFKNQVDLAIHFETFETSRLWKTIELGQIQWQACVRSGHPLLKSPRQRIHDLARYPVVSSAYWNRDHVEKLTDSFPLSREHRIEGVEVQTAFASVEAAMWTDQICYVPSIVAQGAVASGRLQRLNVEDAELEHRPLYLTCQTEKMNQVLLRKIQSCLLHQLREVNIKV